MNRFRYLFLPAVLLILLVSCKRQSDWAIKAAWPDVERFPAAADYPGEGAVIIFDRGKLEIVGKGNTAYTMFEQHRLIKVFNKSGFRFATVTIPYTGSSRIEQIEARSISPSGEITTLEADQIYDINLYPFFIFYSDQRARIFTFPAVEEGSLLEYKFKLTISSQTLYHNWNFQNSVPTMTSYFTIHVPSEWELSYRLYNCDIEAVIDKTPEGFKSTYSWTANDMPALNSEPAMPSVNEIQARLAFSPIGFDTWDDVGDWYYGLSSEQMRADADIESLTDSLTAGIDSSGQKLKIIFEWVRDHVRYIAVAIGIGGFKPNPAGQVLRNRYGDCKDMTTLLCAMARHAGIDLYQALICTQPNGRVDTALVSPFQFNHVIAYSPDAVPGGVWLDATKKGALFGDIPWYNQTMSAFVVYEKGKNAFIRVPGQDYRKNVTEHDWKIFLDESLQAQAIGTTRFSGAPAVEMREYLGALDGTEKRKAVTRFIRERCPHAVLDSLSIKGLQPIEDPLEISFTFQAGHFLAASENLSFFNPARILNIGYIDFMREKQRHYPVRFRFGSRTSARLELYVPPNWEILSSAELDTIRSAFGSASTVITVNEKQARFKLDWALRGQEVPLEQFPEFREFLIHGQQLLGRQVVLSNRGQ